MSLDLIKAKVNRVLGVDDKEFEDQYVDLVLELVVAGYTLDTAISFVKKVVDLHLRYMVKLYKLVPDGRNDE